MKWVVVAAALVGLPSVCLAQAPMDVTDVAGACQPESARTQDGQKTFFGCDSAVFAFFDNRNSHVMVQFTKKGDDKAPMLGFGGTMEQDGVTLDVDRIYLEPGKPQLAEKSSCKMSFTPSAGADPQPDITGIACNGQVSGQSSAVEVVFKPASGQ